MLFQPSQNVMMYLDRASRARERAQQATNEAERKFYENMETNWMKLSASAAFAERVTLFLHSLQRQRSLTKSAAGAKAS